MKVLPFAGVAAAFGFVFLYGHELNPTHDWPPVHHRWIQHYVGRDALFWVNVAFFAIFLIGLGARKNVKKTWMAHGLLTGFFVSLVAEMFGLPLAIYLISAVGADTKLGDKYLQAFGHLPISIGALISLVATGFVAWCWRELYRADGPIVTSGIYSRVRHPQYLGLTVFALGWLLHWPTVIGIFTFPLLTVAYISAAYAEEKELLSTCPAYRAYRERTGFYFPVRQPKNTED